MNGLGASASHVTIARSAQGAHFQVNGQRIYRGYGGFKSESNHFKDAVKSGIVFFDGAVAYKDAPKIREALVGRDIRQYVLSSKIPGSKLIPDNLKGSTENCFNEIVKDLGVEKLNILYLHGPDCVHKDVLDVLVKLKDEGKLEHIGLSNVNKETIEKLVKERYPISVVQNEFNPHFWNQDVLNYCHAQGIVVVGYRPFGEKFSSEIFKNEVLNTISARVQSSVQAVILQWMNQHGVTAIPHSNNIEHILANATLPTWTLTDAEMAQIDGIKAGRTSTCPWEKFLNKDLFAKSTEWLKQLSAVQPKM